MIDLLSVCDSSHRHIFRLPLSASLMSLALTWDKVWRSFFYEDHSRSVSLPNFKPSFLYVFLMPLWAACLSREISLWIYMYISPYEYTVESFTLTSSNPMLSSPRTIFRDLPYFCIYNMIQNDPVINCTSRLKSLNRSLSLLCTLVIYILPLTMSVMSFMQKTRYSHLVEYLHVLSSVSGVISGNFFGSP